MMIDAPSPSSSAFFPRSVTYGKRNSKVNRPDAGVLMLGRSPRCGPLGFLNPCWWPSGLKCGPAVVNGGSHRPTACTWMACSPSPSSLTVPRMSRPAYVSVSVIVPTRPPTKSRIMAVAVALNAGAGCDVRGGAELTGTLVVGVGDGEEH